MGQLNHKTQSVRHMDPVAPRRKSGNMASGDMPPICSTISPLAEKTKAA
jgi:hypothetical protein